MTDKIILNHGEAYLHVVEGFEHLKSKDFSHFGFHFALQLSKLLEHDLEAGIKIIHHQI